MRCKDFEKRILDLIDGKIDFKEKKFIERHIQVCDRCKNLYNDFVFILEKAKGIHHLELKEEFWKSKLDLVFERRIHKFLLKPVLIGVFLFFLIVGPLIKRVYFLSPQKIPVSVVKTDVFNHELPFTEDEIIKYSDYMSEKEVEKILDFFFSNF
ncbi:MAG: zf-HC2 domain-containing protein [Candidatus Omnitrophica bacterium]|nr:zf-HC2 domain-containing protein [Candidatus Omnitrophota bacterium]MCM8807357.1 zf-HC2 domain-containing protein [Candidatus Omnitrophota bacterium]